MADEIKPLIPGSTTPPLSSPSPSGLTSLKPSGTSPSPPTFAKGFGGHSKATEDMAGPLIPDIKILPDLPTNNIKLPVPLKPSVPQDGSSQANQPLTSPLSPPLPQQVKTPSVPQAPTAGLKPTVPSPLTSQPNQPSAIFKSSIRTMQDDLAALKKGQPPAGFKIEKESEKEAKPVFQPPSPKITPSPPISHVELGKLEKARPMIAEAQNGQETQKLGVPTPPSIGLSQPSISIPSIGGILNRFKGRPDFRRIIMYAIVGFMGFVVTAYLIPYLSSLPVASISPTPSATLTRAPTISPVSIESFFSVVDNVGISLGPDFTARFINSAKIDPLLSTREPGIYKITSVDGTKRYGFSEFFSGVSVTVFDELKSLVDDGNLWLTLTYKTDNTISFGFVIKLSNSNMANKAMIALQNWEGTMTQALANFFRLDSTKAASIGFLVNTYNGMAVRYRNFPDPNSTIDYSVIQAKNDESYLVLVNSREHIYKMLDKLK